MTPRGVGLRPPTRSSTRRRHSPAVACTVKCSVHRAWARSPIRVRSAGSSSRAAVRSARSDARSELHHEAVSPSRTTSLTPAAGVPLTDSAPSPASTRTPASFGRGGARPGRGTTPDAVGRGRPTALRAAPHPGPRPLAQRATQRAVTSHCRAEGETPSPQRVDDVEEEVWTLPGSRWPTKRTRGSWSVHSPGGAGW